ncbi:hypothetical protein DVS77_30045 [Mycolicibacterium moriokaense]|nr:hypothetical protein DVS77_30045 [Mycolicibacterium moriokaense]
MTQDSQSRTLTAEEVDVLRTMIATSSITEGRVLLDDIDGALVSQRTPWILDITTPNTAPGSSLPNGPFPANAFVPSRLAYQGEILIWIAGGHLSGLEYAWVTDEPPTRWPRPDEMEVVDR